MLHFSFRRASTALIVLGLFAGTSGFFLKVFDSKHDAAPTFAPAAVCATTSLRGPLCMAAMIDRLPGAADACRGKSASDGCDVVLLPMSIPGECARGPGHSLYCAPRRWNAPDITPDEREVREQSTNRW